MQNESKLQKLEAYFVAGLGMAVVLGIAFAVSTPLSTNADRVKDVSAATPRAASVPASEPVPAVLEPALRSLDGVSYHG
jgi:hypothetical protein